MRIGVVFPQTEIGADAGAVRDYAQTAEALGYDHISVFDHVIGANPASRPGQRFFYNHESNFHEPFVLFGYMAAITACIEFCTSIVILPQRQTVLAAKQAAALDVLSRGRFRFGVGLGWNAVEYEALSEDFHTRGRRVEEQIELMRKLWTEPLVTFTGKYHTVTDAGLNPLPVQRPIPVWMGGGAVDASLNRIARIADGWFPQVPLDQAADAIGNMRGMVREAGRDPGRFGIEGRVSMSVGGPDEWGRAAETWRRAGATHFSVNTMGAKLESPAAHIDAIRRVHDVLKGLY